jgi:hypothetical protein
MKRRDFLKAPAAGMLLTPGFRFADSTPRKDELQGQSDSIQQDIQQKMHPDFITFFPGIEYFYLGNGDIMGVVQYSPIDTQASFFGLTLMNAERFCRKWSTFLYHPERGFGATRMGVTIDEERPVADTKSGMYVGVKGYAVGQENFKSIQRKYPDNIPVVSLIWMAGECEVEEEFFVPSEGAILFRRAKIKNLSTRMLKIGVGVSLYANFGLFDEIATDEKEKTAHAYGVEKMILSSLDRDVTVAGRYDVRVNMGTVRPGESKQATYAYSIRNGAAILKKKSFSAIWKETAQYWSDKSFIETKNDTADDFLKTSKACMKTVVARSGKMDAGPWMYNMEWVSDHALAVEALLHCGMFKEARTMIERNLAHAIGPDGRTIESSRWFGYDYTELNQNGMLLYGLWVYLCWTGDLELARKYWKKIELCAKFPLLEVFRDKETKMVKNKREFWERSDTHGIEQGYEMAYQFWVAFGLEKAAAIAEAIGKKAAAKQWSVAAAETKNAMLNDPKWRLIEDGHFIKRRKASGEWQRFTIPPDRKRMPPGSQLALNEQPSLEPDAIEVYPIIYRFIDPKGELSLNTLKWVEQTWNYRWEGGGYPRYNSTGEDNPPSPWPLASMLIARAYAEAGNDEKVWRVLDWLQSVGGGKSGGWFERYGQSITPPMPPVGVVNWIWYEILSLFILDVIGFRPQLDHLEIKPRLLSGLDEIRSRFKIREARINLTVKRSNDTTVARVNGKEMTIKDGSLSIPYPTKGTTMIEFTIAG